MSCPQQQVRDRVYCHQCENEWYRDEHGLECPECHSDVVEIIEPNHDPRLEMHEQEHVQGPEHDLPLLALFGPRTDAPQPDQEGAPEVRHESFDTPEGHHHIHRTFHYSSQGGDQRTGPPGANAVVQDLLGNLLRSVGGMTAAQAAQQGGGPQPQQQGRQPGQTPGSEAPPVPSRPDQEPFSREVPARRVGSPSPAGPHVTHRQFQWGPVNISMVTSSRSTLNGRPVNSPTNDTDLDGMMGNVFGGIMRPAPGGRGFIITSSPGVPANVAGPLGMMLASLGMGIDPSNARMGDAVFTDEALDRLITRFMEQNQTSSAPGPASAEAINALPKKTIDKDMVDPETGKAECSICMDECEIGSEVTILPCKHWFHFECIKAWLTEHDTCPQCRRGITPREGDQNRPRDTGEAPRHWQAPTLSRRNTQENVLESPQASRVPSGHRYGATPSASEASRSERFSRSRSPARGSSNQGSSGGGFASHVADGIRNGIVGWMGRRFGASDGGTEHNSNHATLSAEQRNQAGSSHGSGPSAANRPRGGGRDDLDNPEVD